MEPEHFLNEINDFHLVTRFLVKNSTVLEKLPSVCCPCLWFVEAGSWKNQNQWL